MFIKKYKIHINIYKEMHETIHFLTIHSDFKDSGQGFGITRFNHLKMVAFVYVYVFLLICICTVCMKYH